MRLYGYKTKYLGEISMDFEKIALEVREELMIYIANNLPFVIKGSFLTSQYHSDPCKRLLTGGDIDLIYANKNSRIRTPKKFDYYSYHQFIRKIEQLLKNELMDIFYKLEEIMTRKLNLSERPEFILELEELGYEQVFKDSDTIYLFLVNYAADGDFTTVGLEIYDRKISIEIDIAIDMPLHFQPETILYRTITGKEVWLKNTTPLLYQTAWKIHQILVRPRFKDLNDVIHFLPHIDWKDKKCFENFLYEIISECKLADKKTCRELLSNFRKLLSQNQSLQSFIINNISPNSYYYDLYHMYDDKKLRYKICSDFYLAIQKNIPCEAALAYLDMMVHEK